MEDRIRNRASVLFSAMAHETRIRIVEIVTLEGKTVGQISRELGTSQSNTSQHLAVLARAGVLAVDRVGTSRFYRLRGPRIPRILDLIEEFCVVHHLYGGEESLPDSWDSQK